MLIVYFELLFEQKLNLTVELRYCTRGDTASKDEIESCLKDEGNVLILLELVKEQTKRILNVNIPVNELFMKTKVHDWTYCFCKCLQLINRL